MSEFDRARKSPVVLRGVHGSKRAKCLCHRLPHGLSLQSTVVWPSLSKMSDERMFLVAIRHMF